MTSPALPYAFTLRMRELLGAETDAYFSAMEQPYTRGLRWNPRKPVPHTAVEGILAAIPWAPNGYYLSAASQAGSQPLHEAGAYYLQEPSAMIPASVLAPMPGERILDLCAAPGGKSTQLADALEGKGLLVCNEPVPSRAQVLSRNLERMGIPNALAVSADPARLADAWPSAFDAILVDAPCSGEGMFRRHPETRAEWNENAPAGCAIRQKRILESAFSMLKPGGRLVYSTCTLSREENEEVIEALLRAHPDFSPVDFSVPAAPVEPLRSHKGMLRIYPHKVHGEGHFVALLRKAQDMRSQATRFVPASAVLGASSKDLLQAYANFHALPFLPNAVLGEQLLCAPDLPPLRGIKVLRAGVHLGNLKGKIFSPDHALALALSPPYSIPSVPLSYAQAKAYQAGETLPFETAPQGYALATYQGLALGFVKGSDEQLKNHYPKGLRRPV